MPLPAYPRWRIASAMLALLAACGLARANEASESDLKPAFVYNFLVLTTWPVEANHLRLCIAGVVDVPAAFRRLGGKGVRERTLSVVGIPGPERPFECHALFIPRVELGRMAGWLAAASRQATLTIAEGATGPGPILNLRASGGQFAFDVDTRAAQAASLVLSSQLLKLAASRR